VALQELLRRPCGTCARQSNSSRRTSSHPSILYGSGALLALSGSWGAGLEGIRESNRLNPYHPGYQHVHLALDRLMAGDHTGMLAEASLLTHPEDLWGPLIRCLAFIGLGHDDRAWQELDAALAVAPDLLEDDAALIAEQLLDAPLDVRIRIRERLLGWLANQRDRAKALAEG
jgi:hypothetical protein